MHDNAVGLLIRNLATVGMLRWAITLAAMAAIVVGLSYRRDGRPTVPVSATWTIATLVGAVGGVWGLMAAFLAFADGRFPVRVDLSTCVIAFMASALIARLLIGSMGMVFASIRNAKSQRG